jgi:hypothetical protein
MRRRLFTLCTALSLLLCAAACALWVRSYRRLDRLSADVGGAERSIAVVRGMVHWFCSPDPDHTYPTGYSSVRPGEWHTARGQVVRVGGRRDVFPGNPVLARHWSGCVAASGRCSPCVAEYPEASPAGPVLRVVPLQQVTSPRPPGYRPRYRQYTAGAAPIWPVPAATAVLPAAWLAAVVRRRRHHGAGLCRRCGYDIRATPDRCPECGTVLGRKQQDGARRAPTA